MAAAGRFAPFRPVPLGSGEAVRLAARSAPARATAAPAGASLAFHRSLDGYRETPLLNLAGAAAELGLEGLYVKDESERLELPSFKVLGASWAIYRLLGERLGAPPRPGATVAELRAAFAPLAPLTLVAATDGNHGRAVARTARLFGFAAEILVPADMATARIAAIEAEGARVETVAGSYDDAVAAAAARAAERVLVVADTAWAGYEEVPRWISEGYATIFREVDEALARRRLPEPDLVAVQIGVGALARAVVAHYRRPGSHPRLLGVEPLDAACALATLVAGRPVAVPGPHRSVMAGLNCGVVSTLALPTLAAGLDAVAAIPDEPARRAVRLLAAEGVVAGETGAAGLAGLLALPEAAWKAIGGRPRRPLVIVTEGATDPASYAAALAGTQPAADSR